jgi:nicotinamide riboside transporter PnuC
MQTWSWILAAIGITGIWLAGSRRTIGWTIGVAAQLLWIAYAIATHQWGFIASALAYGFVYARNWAKWRRETAENDGLALPSYSGKSK